MRQAFEAATMDVLLFQRPDQALHHAVLLGTVRRDELLLETIAAHKLGVGTRREDQPIVAAKKEWLVDIAQRAEPSDQCVNLTKEPDNSETQSSGFQSR